ncbi:MAG: hypothetical protein KU38_00885 [Sulfurovum sp. FS08-3]|nr:MAG: hypothetical protein KU38_00885 [Sulfurovum sp. FS08-3]
MSNTLVHDSTKTLKPIIYQFLIALEKCFEMQNNESIWIEKYGDVTSSSGEQVEVKDYQKNLTDLDHNVWKTLKNWLDDGFDVSYYHSLILSTTQTISPTSKFIDWNNKNKDEKLEILNSIKKEFDEKKKKSIEKKTLTVPKSTEEKEEKPNETQILLNKVFDSTKSDKLLTILEKFIIQSEAENDETLYKRLIETKTTGVISDKKNDYINSLMGFIVNPVITSNGWEITYQSFQARVVSLLEELNSKTVIFPSTYRSVMATSDEETEHSDYTFVKKIDAIKYNEVKIDAISDFIYTRKIITEELRGYEVSKIHYDNYEKEIHDSYISKYRNASLGTENARVIRDSKIFYNSVTGHDALPFRNFKDTPKRFRNGLLHQMADDDGDTNERKVIWKLKVEEDE